MQDTATLDLNKLKCRTQPHWIWQERSWGTRFALTHARITYMILYISLYLYVFKHTFISIYIYMYKWQIHNICLTFTYTYLWNGILRSFVLRFALTHARNIPTVEECTSRWTNLYTLLQFSYYRSKINFSLVKFDFITV